MEFNFDNPMPLDEVIDRLPRMLDMAMGMMSEDDAVVLANQGKELAEYFIGYLAAAGAFMSNPLAGGMTIDDLTHDLLGVSLSEVSNASAPKDVVDKEAGK